MVALRLSEDDLSRRDQDDFLPELFTQVNGIERMNRKVGDARSVIADAERSLAFVTIPFVLSVYQAFGSACLRLVTAQGDEVMNGEVPSSDLERLHPNLETAGLDLPSELIELFDVVRKTRNRIVHYAGVRGSYLKSDWRNLSGEATEIWRHITGRDFPAGAKNDVLDLGIGELLGTMAVVTRLGREVNAALGKVVPTARWARIAAEDFRVVCPDAFSNEAIRPRKLKKFADINYRPIDFSDGQLEAAVADLRANLNGS